MASVLSASPPLAAGGVTTLLGETALIVNLRAILARMGDVNPTVLLQGESGTGKEVVARVLGESGGGVFVKINCAAIPAELWESELFGYESGAFTGAQHAKPGKFELAEGGTIFLDEISEMPLPMQAKLLQVVQDGEFSRLGGLHSRCVHARVIAATNINLRAAVEAGEFRRDLYYRLNVITLSLPPLRDRRADIPLLTEHFLETYAARYHRTPPPLSPAITERLRRHSWPGNVRELENLIKRYVILDDEGALLSDLMTPPVANAGDAAATAGKPPASIVPAVPGGASLLEIGRCAAREAETSALLATLNATHWNRRLAARQLQISYKSLQNKIKRLLPQPRPKTGTD